MVTLQTNVVWILGVVILSICGLYVVTFGAERAAETKWYQRVVSLGALLLAIGIVIDYTAGR